MVYDCFPFFNELDILEIRLHVLNEVVDHFVIVESTLTHQGKPKELYYENNKNRFSKFHNKITHIVSDTFPKPDMSSWEYEQFQRNEIRRGLVNCQPNDAIIISDLDEIPDPKGIAKAMMIRGIKIFRQKMYCYFLNCSADTGASKKILWNGPVMTTYKTLTQPQDLRNLAIRSMKLNSTSSFKRIVHRLGFVMGNIVNSRSVTVMDNGGWHFSYMGGPKKIIEKLEAFAHTEFNLQELKDEKRISERINKGLSVYDNLDLQFVPLDSTYPKYILENQERYAHLIKHNS